MLNWLTYKVLAYIAAALAVAVIGLSVALWASGVRVGKAQNDRDKARNQVTLALQTIDEQKRVLQECSDRTDALVAEGKKRQADADKAVATARAEAGRYQQEAKRLRALSASPTPSGADCRQALREIRSQPR